MRIERIERISDYRIFRNYEWPGDLPGFSRYNLIYGWNGTGKTTLSSIYRTMQDKQSIASGEIRVRIDGDLIQGGQFDSVDTPSIRVFNRDTVDRTLFEEPHQELPPVYYLGEKSAEKQREVVRLKGELEGKQQEIGKISIREDSEMRLLEKHCIDEAGGIKNMLTAPGGGAYNNYDKRDYKNYAERLRDYKKSAYCLTNKEYQRCIETKNGVPLEEVGNIELPKLEYTALTQKVDELLKRSVVSTIISELVDAPELAAWVQSGLDLHTGARRTEACHFCKQNIPVGRISELGAHFSDELSKLQSEIDQGISEIEAYIQSIGQFVLPAQSLLYPHFRDRYEKETKNWNSTKLSLVSFLKTLVASLKAKRDEPFKKLDITSVVFIFSQSSKDSGWILKALAGLLDVAQNAMTVLGLSAIDRINKLFTEHNQYTKEFTNQMEEARNELAHDYVSKTLFEYDEYVAKLAQLEKDSLEIKSEITQVTECIDQLEVEVREYRKAADELNSEMKSYLGRDELQFELSDNGYRIARNGEPALHLSEGERTAISFMYFLKTLEDENFDLGDGIVVIDDPISSLDSNSMYSAFGFMKEKTKNANQLFVLTHSFSFYRLVRGWFFRLPDMRKKDVNRHPARFYLLDCYIENNQRSARIGEIDPLLRDYESEYHFLFKKVYDEAKRVSNGQQLEAYYGLPNIARRLLESFLTFKLPHFEAGKLEKKLDEIAYDNAKKTRILRFLHVNSHNDQVGAPEHDISILSETPAILVDLMELIRTVDPDHFNGMELLINPPADEEEVRPV